MSARSRRRQQRSPSQPGLEPGPSKAATIYAYARASTAAADITGGTGQRTWLASTVTVVPGVGPFARLPDDVTFTLSEVSALLEALDIGEAAVSTDEDRAAVRDAIRTITSKLWPELGDILDDEGEG